MTYLLQKQGEKQSLLATDTLSILNFTVEDDAGGKVINKYC